MESVEKTYLNGYSGCKIYKYSTENRIIVRKISKDCNYNSRFESQLEKQKWFEIHAQNFNMGIGAPKILKVFNDSNLVNCEMEYIEGDTLNDYSKINEEDMSNILFEKLTKYFETVQNIEPLEVVGDSFADKLWLKLKELLKDKKFDKKMKSDFIKGFDKIKDVEIKSTFCHGDFTLENMICSTEKNIYLIDFLDSFYPHFWFDIAKLYQELEAGWQYIKNDLEEPHNYRCNRLKKRFDKYFSENHPDYAENHYFLLALTLARIIPYTKSKSIENKLMGKIENYILKYNNNNKLGE